MSQRKACVPCASSKRKCDRELPGCVRCLKRGIECVYAQRKRRRADTSVQSVSMFINPEPIEPNCIDMTIDVDTTNWNWDATDRFNLVDEFALDDLALGILPSFESTPTLSGWPLKTPVETTTRPWYLQLESWKLQHHTRDPDCALEINYDPYVMEVRAMLRSWSTVGYNTFIHRKLYERRMPRCIQEAFTTLAAYFHCDSSMKSAVLQIAQDHSDRLTHEQLPEIEDEKQVLEHLARVHALFAYVFVRLFDGSVRLRVTAEKQIPLLRSWVAEMVTEATKLEVSTSKVGNHAVQWRLKTLDAEFEHMSEQWETWLIAECVRRTHVIVNTILNVYLCLSVGQAECSGFLMLTARHGLWQAESATSWSKIVSSKSPLLISLLNPGHLICEYSANEFDEVVQLLWKYIVGPERIQRWVENSNRIEA